MSSPRVDDLSPEQLDLLVRRLRVKPPDTERGIEAQDRTAGPFPLSFAQERLWFLDRFEPQTATYNIAGALHLRGRLDEPSLVAALNFVVARHEALRTCFESTERGPVQFLLSPPPTLRVPRVDLRALPVELRARRSAALARTEAERPLDLRSGLLLRVLLLTLDVRRSDLTFCLHHIAGDGWSCGLFVREVGEVYAATTARRRPALPRLPVQYIDFAVWQRGRLAAPETSRLLDFWRRELAGLEPLLALPADRARPPVQGHRGGRVRVAVGGELKERVAAYAVRLGTTPFSVLLAAWSALLVRSCDQRDLAIATPFAGRTRTEVEGLIGCFVNTIVLRMSSEPGDSFDDLVARALRVVGAATAHQEMPFERLVHELAPNRSLSHAPLAQTAFSFGVGSWPATFADLDLLVEDVDTGTAKFDLLLSLGAEKGGFAGFLEYGADLFDRTTVLRLSGRYLRLLERALSSPQDRVAALELLAPIERRQLLGEWNPAGIPAAQPPRLERWVEEAAARWPGRAAIVAEGREITYAELVRGATELACRLIAIGIRVEDRVAVRLRRTPDLVVALLAILKAGAAYVPLDPDHPAERSKYVLGQSRAALLITEAEWLDALDFPAVLAIEHRSDAPSPMPDGGPAVELPGGALAYVIYTSGTTGRPKGVAISHASAVERIAWVARTFSEDELSGFLAATSICFDLSVFELFGALCLGGTAILARDALEIATLASRDRIRLVNTVPSAMAEILAADALPASVRTVNLAGEALPADLLRRLEALGTVTRILNLYGPSEDTTYSTVAVVRWESDRAPAIGRPLDNTRVYVLDGEGNPVPVGVQGELLIGGNGLARGYFDRPDFTAERFTPDPFVPAPGRRLYRTGDLARWRADGQLEFLGRVDQQVKLRGFRIELGEIEAVLAEHPRVEESAVVVRESAGERRLVGYVGGRNVGAAREEIDRYLRTRLPEYMVPWMLVPLDVLPRNANGKIDRRALPAPEARASSPTGRDLPRTPVEQILAAIWQDVLGVSEVGVRDDFFALGGHSLLAARVANRIGQGFGVELPLRRLFEARTIEELARSLEGGGLERALPPVERGPDGGPAPLSFAQERLWFLDRIGPKSAAYNMPARVVLRGDLDYGELVASATAATARHAPLRSRIVERGGELITVALEASFPLPVIALDGLPSTGGDLEANRIADACARLPFALAEEPPQRAVLVRRSVREHHLVWVFHHVCADGWSVRILAGELVRGYEGARAGVALPTGEPEIRYRDYSRWQRSVWTHEASERALSPLRRRFSNAPEMLHLPTDRPRGMRRSGAGGHHPAHLSNVQGALFELCRAEAVTPFMVLLGGWAALVARFSGDRDLVVGAPIADRPHAALEGLVGLFVNTLAFRLTASPDQSFASWIRSVRGVCLEAFAHKSLPFEQLVEGLGVPRRESRSPLFQLLFSLEDDVAPPRFSSGSLEVTLEGLSTGAARIDLSLLLARYAEGFRGTVEYDADLFDRSTIERWAEAYERLLRSGLADPERRWSDLDVLSADEREQLVRSSGGRVAPRFEGSVVEQVERWALRQPTAPAVVEGALVRTYGDLWSRTNRWARAFDRLGVVAEEVVALVLPRGLALIEAALAVVKAGGCYLPIDPGNPADRVAYMLADARVRRVVGYGDFGPSVRTVSPEDLERFGEAPPGSPSGDSFSANSAGAALAYVIYTSGSTGRPRGVASTHAGLANLASWHRQAHDLSPTDRTTLLAGVGFDASVWELWGSLCAGASLYVVPPEVVSGGRLWSWLAERKITVSFMPTPLAESLLEESEPAVHELRSLLVGGDRLHRGVSGRRFGLWNHYGPTEATVVTTWGRSEAGDLPAIGRPIDNVRCYVVDGEGALASPGVVGELYVGGQGVGRGYVGQADRTALLFAPDGWSGEPGARVYRTGDLVRWLPTTELSFVGRRDEQVKVRGFRIELGEIEAVLGEHPAVEAAVVLVLGAGTDQRLVAYVGAPGGHQLAGDLEAYLGDRLPPFMLPSALIVLPELPKSLSGKLDRRALAEHGDAAPTRSAESMPPRNRSEQLVADLWAEVFGRDAVGVEDDFFALGGHSLLATRIVARLREATGVEVPIRLLLEGRTVAAVAAALDAETKAEGGRLMPIRAGAHGPELPLSFAQERIWFLERFEPGTATYNIPAGLLLHGSLQFPALATAFGRLVERHEILRTAFALIEGHPVQRVLPRLDLAIGLTDLSALVEARRAGEAQRLAHRQATTPFDLDRPPLLRVALLRLDGATHALLLTIHHVIADGWSMGLLVREVARLYESPEPLEPLSIQYGDYAVWQRRALEEGAFAPQIEYWRGQLAGAPPALDLPTDRPRPPVQRFRAGRRTFRLGTDLSADLQALGRRQGATPFMVLLSAFGLLLHRWSGEQDLVVGTPVAGRVRRELEGLIGLFLNSLALRLDYAGDPSWRALLARVRGCVIDAYSNQDLPVEKLIETLAPIRDTTRSSLFQVFLNMLSLPPMPEGSGELTFSELESAEVGAKLDLTLYVREEASTFRLDLVYDADLFDPARIEEMLAQLGALLAQIAADPERPIGAFSLVTDAARAILPDPALPLDADWRGTVSEALRRFAATVPDRIAVTDALGAVTYAAVERTSREVAEALVRGGVRPGDAVAVWAHLSAPLVGAILGVQRAGAAFVILDPAYPGARLAAMLEIACPTGWVELSAAVAPPGEVVGALARVGCSVTVTLARDEVSTVPARSGPVAIDPVRRADDPALVAFTSGSTGVPKGIVGRHGPLSHFIPWQRREFGMSERDRFTMLSALSHDPLQRDVFTPLQIGAEIVIPDPAGMGRPGWLANWLAESQATCCHLTPAMGRLILEGAVPEQAPALRLTLLVGDILTLGDAAGLRRLAPRVQVVNLYGSTETQRSVGYHCAVSATGTTVADGGRQILPLGKGIEGVQLLVLRTGDGMCGVGELGEISIRSHHLAQGYLGDAKLSGERFLENPFISPAASGDRLYRTGDLGRYLPNGEVAFAGRADQQVKIRGFRIELGEIEAQLKKHPAVADAVVVALDDAGDRFLAAYLVAVGEPVAELALRKHLAAHLPEAMIPTTMTWLPAIPLTPNRKVDRRALPKPARPVVLSLDGAPATPIEGLVAAIWADVLGVATVDRGRSFFDLGGHSLLAAQAVARLRDAFGVDLPLRRLFELPNLTAVAREIEAAQDRRGTQAPLTRRSDDSPAPLSFAQERLWFLEELQPGTAAFHLPLGLELDGPLSIPALNTSLQAVVARQDSLRTRFEHAAGVARQVVYRALRLPLPVVDLAGVSPGRSVAHSTALFAAAAMRPFALETGPLVRFLLVRIAEDRHRLLLVSHHLISDGWSTGVLCRELSMHYGALVEGGRVAELPDLTVRYADFASWQRGLEEHGGLDLSLDFWRRYLEGAPAALELPTDRPRAATGLAGRHLHSSLPARLAASLRAVGRPRGATMFMTLLAAFEVFLSRWSGQDDLIVGTPVAGRDRVEVEGVIGLFVNTLPLRADLKVESTFGQLVDKTRRDALAVFEHRDLPFAQLVEAVRPDRSLARAPLFQAMLVLQNPPTSPPLRGLSVRALEVETGAAQLDLTLSVAETEQGLALAWEYAAGLFESTTVLRFEASFRRLLEAAAENPDSPWSQLSVLHEEARAQLLVEWNDTEAAYPREATLVSLFEEQVDRTPDAVALATAAGELTYRELDRRANGVARRLVTAGALPEVAVPVCLERTADLVVALLAVLKAGGAYVPLDPRQPRERMAAALQDVGARFILTESSIAPRLVGWPTLAIDFDGEEPRASSQSRLLLPVLSSSLAYVIFTSGSTGRPKGVAIEHRSAVDLVFWARRTFAPDDLAAVLATTSVTFDLSVFEIFVPLASGGTILLVEDALAVATMPVSWNPRLLNTVPSAAAELVRSGALPTSVRTVNLAGEALPRELVESLYGLGVKDVFNLYGPTEDTTYSTGARIEPGAPGAPSIGRPIDNTRAYLLGRGFQPVPRGATGEIFLGGENLARGYLARPELTAERFLPDPFAGPGARMYRTGDLARHGAAGRLDYLGRRDQQIKLRGFRIEIGEIEVALAAHPDVREAAVAVRIVGREPGLVAYVVGEEPPDVGALREHLRARLPEYMIPAAFAPLAALPRTANGKLDRQALPEVGDLVGPPRQGRNSGSLIEEEVLAVWQGVLGESRFGLDDSFFDIGGHSLLATQVAARLRDRFGIDLPLREFFVTPTIAGLARSIESALEEKSGESPPPLVRRTHDRDLPLSYAQQRLWLLCQLAPDNPFYNLAGDLTVVGALDEAGLEAALAAVVARHESLRTSFVGVEGRPEQRINPALPGFPLVRVDLAAVPEGRRETERVRVGRSEARRPFDLERAPLFRATLLRLGGTERALLIGLHHLIADGWSISVLLVELRALYEARLAGRPAALAELPIQYADFSSWQRDWLAGGVLERQLDYWRRHLAGAPVSELPADRPRPPVQSYRGATRRYALGGDLAAALRSLARREAASLYMVWLSTFQVFLARSSGGEDLLVGTPIANRTRREVEGLIGCFVNTLVLRTDLEGDPNVSTLIGRVREVAFAAYAHQDLPFELLVEALHPRRDLSRNPLFQVMINLLPASSGALRLGAATLTPRPAEGGTAMFDLQLYAQEREDGIDLAWEYATDLFDPATVERFARSFETLLRGAVSDPGARLSALPLLGVGDRAALLTEWNDTRVEREPSFVHREIAAQAASAPDAPAVVCGDETLTYGELDRRSNRFARRLASIGVGAESRVGVAVERSLGLVVAVLGVLKAGAAYVPLDPSYPTDRLAYMAQDAGLAVVLKSAGSSLAFSFDGPVMEVESDDESPPSEAHLPVDDGASPDNLAYVIYTSGSTGRPKGVQVPHRGVSNIVAAVRGLIGFGPGETCLAVTSLSFDIATVEIFMPLVRGGRVVVARRDEVVDGARLDELIRRWDVSLVQATPATWRLLLEAGWQGSSLLSAVCSGEALPPSLSEALRPRVRRLWNLYGPTETTVWSTGELVVDSISIGRPIDNTQVQIVDRWGGVAPIGVVGEIAIGGEGVVRGYLGRADLTADRFVPDGYGAFGSRLYRTGDLARRLSDGRIECLGRADSQVKIRGYRIELGEVESVLAAHPDVAAAAAGIWHGPRGDARLVGYAVPRGSGLAEPALREWLRSALPEPMVPADFVILERLPLTPNGKIDRHRLPPPEGQVPEVVEGARGPLEEMVAAIFGEVLGLPAIGRDEDFFERGGHSLLATQVVARLRSAVGADLGLQDLFESSTVSRLAERLERQVAGGAGRPSSLPRAMHEGVAPVSFSQDRMWFLDRLEAGSAAYNLGVALRIRGAFDGNALTAALAVLSERHETLRTAFDEIDGEAVQLILPSAPLAARRVDLEGLAGELQTTEALRAALAATGLPFDLRRAPLLRVVWLRLNDQEHGLAITTHHIVSDGASLDLLTEELATLYSSALEGRPHELPPPSVQYADFAIWQRGWLSGEVLQEQAAYWEAQLALAPPLSPLPTDRPRANRQTSRGADLPLAVPREISVKLLELSRALRITPFMALLAAYKLLLHAHGGGDDLVIGTPISYRNWREIERAQGFFVNTLVLRTHLGGEPTFGELAARLRSTVISAFAHQDLPFNKLVGLLRIERSLGYNPLFQIGFTFAVGDRRSFAPGALALDRWKLGNESTQFDLNLTIGETADGYSGSLQYSAELFDAATIAGLVADYLAILRHLVERGSEVRLSELRGLVAANIAERREIAARRLGEASLSKFRRRLRQSIATGSETDP